MSLYEMCVCVCGHAAWSSKHEFQRPGVEPRTFRSPAWRSRNYAMTESKITLRSSTCCLNLSPMVHFGAIGLVACLSVLVREVPDSIPGAAPSQTLPRGWQLLANHQILRSPSRGSSIDATPTLRRATTNATSAAHPTKRAGQGLLWRVGRPNYK